jgi:hypothetical protein
VRQLLVTLLLFPATVAPVIAQARYWAFQHPNAPVQSNPHLYRARRGRTSCSRNTMTASENTSF